jgi:hypothetical protein
VGRYFAVVLFLSGVRVRLDEGRITVFISIPKTDCGAAGSLNS